MTQVDFADRLAGLIEEALESLGADDIITELELRKYALEETEED